MMANWSKKRPIQNIIHTHTLTQNKEQAEHPKMKKKNWNQNE